MTDATAPDLFAARAAFTAARADLQTALVAAIGDLVQGVYPHAAQLAFTVDTGLPAALTRVEVADDDENVLGVLTPSDAVFDDLVELHAELVDTTGDVEAELELCVAG